MTERRIIIDDEGEVRDDRRPAVERTVSTTVTPMADRVAPHETIVVDDAPVTHHVVREAVVTDHATARGAAGIAQVVDYLFYVVYLLLGVRLALNLLGANPRAEFVQWLAKVTDPLYAPFRGIFPNVTVDGGKTLALSLAFAIVIYALLHGLVKALLRMVAYRRTVI